MNANTKAGLESLIRSHQGGGEYCDTFYMHRLTGKVDGFDVTLEVRSHWSDAAKAEAKAKLVTLAIVTGLIPIGGY